MPTESRNHLAYNTTAVYEDYAIVSILLCCFYFLLGIFLLVRLLLVSEVGKLMCLMRVASLVLIYIFRSTCT